MKLEPRSILKLFLNYNDFEPQTVVLQSFAIMINLKFIIVPGAHGVFHFSSTVHLKNFHSKISCYESV